MSYSSAVLADSPAFYARMGDASGTTMTDSSGNSHNGTYASGTTLGATGLLLGDANTAVDFASGSASVAGAAWMATTTTVTVEALIQPDTVSGASYNFIAVRDDNNGTGNVWWLVIKSGKLTALCRGTEFSGSTTLVAGNTYHVAFTYDGTTAKLYLNGSLDGSSARAGAMSTTNYDIIIGRWGNSGLPLYFDGRIDEVAYYTSALSSTRIAAHYTAATVIPDATVNAPAATATASAVAPVATATSTVTAPAASATASGPSPAVTGTGDATVLAPAATATASALSPTVSADASVAAPAAAASGAGVAPVATASVSILAPTATAAADGLAPAVTDGTGNRTVLAPPATATATALAPLVTASIDTEGDDSNVFTGLDLVCVGVVTVTAPVVPAPFATTTVRVDKAIALPLPVLVNGRPT